MASAPRSNNGSGRGAGSPRPREADRTNIQAFIGSLAGQGVTKGIFITTISFAESAKEFVLRGSNTKVVLLDGEALLD